MNRLSSVLLLLVVGSGCAHLTGFTAAATPSSKPEAASASATPAAPAAMTAASAPAPEASTVAQAAAATAASGTPEAAAASAEAASEDEATASEEEDSGEPGEAGDAGEAGDIGESRDAPANPNANGRQYTAELSDEELAKRWKESPATLGSISVGFVDEGRMVNAEQFPPGDGWVVVSPEKTWGTKETIDYVIAAIRQVKAQLPNVPPLRVNQISAREGGFLRPHKSHQNGRDVDLGFYYPTAETVWARERERYIDPARNWALLKALITTGDVQFILVDKRVQKVIYDYALKSGEDKAYLDSVFNAGRSAIVQHARKHRDHFHVRYYNPRAQELGRRVAPLLAQRPEYNLAMHRVKKGDTLGAIARKYGTSVAALQKANHLKNSFLRLAQVLKVPLRGPCTQCPIPPIVVVPPRRLPPAAAVAQQKAAPSTTVPAVAEQKVETVMPASAAVEQKVETVTPVPAVAEQKVETATPASAVAEPSKTDPAAPTPTVAAPPSAPSTPAPPAQAVTAPL